MLKQAVKVIHYYHILYLILFNVVYVQAIQQNEEQNETNTEEKTFFGTLIEMKRNEQLTQQQVYDHTRTMFFAVFNIYYCFS